MESPFGTLQLDDDVLACVRSIPDVDSSFALLVAQVRLEILEVLLENLLDPFTAGGPLPTRIQQPEAAEKVLLEDLLLLVAVDEVFELLDDIEPHLDNLAVQ